MKPPTHGMRPRCGDLKYAYLTALSPPALAGFVRPPSTAWRPQSIASVKLCPSPQGGRHRCVTATCPALWTRSTILISPICLAELCWCAHASRCACARGGVRLRARGASLLLPARTPVAGRSTGSRTAVHRPPRERKYYACMPTTRAARRHGARRTCNLRIVNPAVARRFALAGGVGGDTSPGQEVCACCAGIGNGVSEGSTCEVVVRSSLCSRG
ncbi:hypothetical protein BC628DRAFT_960284 [Trametes gibbosa]|nr:hypothetical protein BC628DRAFT_960284 [Trametes gibbosa]